MGAQDKDFKTEHSVNLRGKLHDMRSPWVMGICNLNTDSFYKNSRVQEQDALIARCQEMTEHGAKIIDIGVASSRPGAELISVEEEMSILSPYLDALSKELPELLFSVDTYNAKTAALACDMGACMINDISAGLIDEGMIPTVAKKGVPYVAMHMKGTPKKMQENPEYYDVIETVYTFLSERISACHLAGINDVLIDPGFGFGKTLEHNYHLLNKLNYLSSLHAPILVGVSRKSMLYKPLGLTPEKALNSTTAAHMIALERGAKILRVHDVKEAVEAVKIFQLTSS